MKNDLFYFIFALLCTVFVVVGAIGYKICSFENSSLITLFLVLLIVGTVGAFVMWAILMYRLYKEYL